ncbi:hypothetical protein K490DRAFT_56834 [Saccharata proteae CBS 121410]|uniref:Uncharacterized protein n=1 Tax=Saccharata proteae CBS 121410 TaxID=1314787 RepID=A0A9P4LXK2_9PEZI|nr:hypothetical protein K490DRAFT_56834 [Saccharata proteae CBS 121410]
METPQPRSARSQLRRHGSMHHLPVIADDVDEEIDEMPARPSTPTPYGRRAQIEDVSARSSFHAPYDISFYRAPLPHTPRRRSPLSHEVIYEEEGHVARPSTRRGHHRNQPSGDAWWYPQPIHDEFADFSAVLPSVSHPIDFGNSDSSSSYDTFFSRLTGSASASLSPTGHPSKPNSELPTQTAYQDRGLIAISPFVTSIIDDEPMYTRNKESGVKEIRKIVRTLACGHALEVKSLFKYFEAVDNEGYYWNTCPECNTELHQRIRHLPWVTQRHASAPSSTSRFDEEFEREMFGMLEEDVDHTDALDLQLTPTVPEEDLDDINDNHSTMSFSSQEEALPYSPPHTDEPAPENGVSMEEIRLHRYTSYVSRYIWDAEHEMEYEHLRSKHAKKHSGPRAALRKVISRSRIACDAAVTEIRAETRVLKRKASGVMTGLRDVGRSVRHKVRHDGASCGTSPSIRADAADAAEPKGQTGGVMDGIRGWASVGAGAVVFLVQSKMPPTRTQRSHALPTFHQFCQTDLVLLNRRIGAIARQDSASSSNPHVIFARLLACGHIIVFDSRRINRLDGEDFIFRMRNIDDEGQRRLNSCPKERCGRVLWRVKEPDTEEIWRALRGVGASMSVAGRPTDELVKARKGEKAVRRRILRRTTVAALRED